MFLRPLQQGVAQPDRLSCIQQWGCKEVGGSLLEHHKVGTYLSLNSDNLKS